MATDVWSGLKAVGSSQPVLGRSPVETRNQSSLREPRGAVAPSLARGRCNPLPWTRSKANSSGSMFQSPPTRTRLPGSLAALPATSRITWR
eukprot:3549943-Amphidinium_carterae.1